MFLSESIRDNIELLQNTLSLCWYVAVVVGWPHLTELSIFTVIAVVLADVYRVLAESIVTEVSIFIYIAIVLTGGYRLWLRASWQKWADKKRQDYTFRRQFSEKPSIILGCPVRSEGLQRYCCCADRRLSFLAESIVTEVSHSLRASTGELQRLLPIQR